jgi:tRNA(Ile)-lysidine synthase
MSIRTPSSPPIVPTSLAETSFTAKLERRVRDFVRRHDILRPGERILVAVSGGPDSTAVLVALTRIRHELNIEITAAHFNHMLRRAGETAADLDFVRSLASTLGLTLVHGAGDVRGRARAGHESIEDAARQLRYSFLAENAKEVGASVIVTGHTTDDQAETVLLHLIRGAGLDGVAGMRPRSKWPFRASGEFASGEGGGPDLVRPLLSLPREETEDYCRELGVTPRKDPTNDLPVATRNRLRLGVMPLLRNLNPAVDKALARFAAAAAHDADYLDDLARHHFARIASLGPQTVSFARADLLLAAPALSARLFRLTFAYVTGTAADLEAAHIDALLESLSKPPGKLSLPGGVTAIADSRSVVLRLGEATPAKRIPETGLAVSGSTEAAGGLFESSIVRVPPDARQTTANEAVLDAAKVGRDLTVRSRRPGDRLRPLGLGGEKKLQDILVDAKIPARERDGTPLVCAGNQIAWVVGHCVDERYALDANSRQALRITFTETDKPITEN